MQGEIWIWFNWLAKLAFGHNCWTVLVSVYKFALDFCQGCINGDANFKKSSQKFLLVISNTNTKNNLMLICLISALLNEN